MTEATRGDIRQDLDKLAKVQQADRALAESAVALSNVQTDAIRHLWKGFRELLAALAYAQAKLVETGEHDAAEEIGQEWAGVLDRVCNQISGPDRLN